MRKSFTPKKLAGLALWLLAFFVQVPAKAQFVEDNKRYAIFSTHLADDATGDKAVRDVTYAIDNGCNAVEIGIKWGDLYATATSAPNWNRYDKLINLALSKGVKVALRLCTLRKNYETFFTQDQVMRDARGNPLYDETHFRLGHTPTVNKAQDFIRSVTQRYQYLNQQGHLMFVSIVTTPYLELEYFQVNWRGDGTPPYSITYDYNEGTIADFQQWAVRKYGTLEEVNRRWTTDFRATSDIRPTYPNVYGHQAFLSARGLDWYAFRHAQLKAYTERCIQTIKGIDPTIRIINQHGSVWDGISETRGTYGFKSLAEMADGVKVNDGLDFPHQFSMDLLRSSVKPGQWIFDELDGSTYISDRVDRSSDQLEMMKTVFKYGAKGFTLANFIVGVNEVYLKAILDKMKAQNVLNQPVVTNITPVGTVRYSLSRVVQSNVYEMNVIGQWQNVKGPNGLPVQVIVDEDILAGGPTGNIPPTVENGIPDQQSIVGQAFSYRIPDNTFRDADGQIASVSVSGLPTGLTYTASNRTISGTPSTTGTTEVTVTAMDNQNATVSDYFTLAVRQAASPLRLLDPILTCNTGRFEFRSTDGNGSSVEYKLDGITDWSTGTSITLEDRYRYGSALIVKARQSGTEITLNYTTTCSSTNRPPVVDNPLADRVFAQGQYISFTLPANTFSDPDGQIASISASGLPPGMSYAASERTMSGAITGGGSWSVTITATDNQGATVSDVFVISTSGQIRPLRFLTPTLNCNTGRFEFNTTDGDGTTIEYMMDRVFDWTTQSVQTLSETVRQNDMHFRARQSGVVYFGSYVPNCPPPNRLPVVANPIANQNLTQYRNVSFTIPANTFSDPDGRITAVALSALPTGLAYDANTRTLTGAATVAGSWTITATATDDREGTVSTTFVIAVARDVRALRLLAPVLNCNTGRLEFKTADGDGTTIQYSIDGILNWTTQDAFTLPLQQRFDTPLTIRARQGNSDISITYRTACPRTNLPPVVAAAIPNQVLTVNQPATIAIPATTFTDPDGQITSVTLTGLPVGLTYDPTRRAVTGTPTLIGSSAVIAKAVDNAGASVSDTFQITVRSAPRFTVTANLLDAQGKVLRTINEGDLIDILKIPTLVNMNCVPKTTSGSVLMELTGKVRRSTYANAGPYQLFPVGQGFKPVVGAYQLKVSVFSGPNGTGTVLGTTTMRFDIVTTNEPGSINVLSEK